MPIRMAGGVLLAAVRLGFGDAPPNDGPILQPTAKPRADKCLCHRHRINRIIVCRQSEHFIVMVCSTEIPAMDFRLSFISFQSLRRNGRKRLAHLWRWRDSARGSPCQTNRGAVLQRVVHI